LAEPELERVLEEMARKLAAAHRPEPAGEESGCCPAAKSMKGLVESPSLSEVKQALSQCRVVVITFFTPLCPYCEMLKPVVKAVAKELQGKAVFMRVNALEALPLARALRVFSVPDTFVFVDGKPAHRIPGLYDEEYLAGVVKSHLRELGCAS